MSAIPSIREILPHAGESVLLDTVVDIEKDAIVCETLLANHQIVLDEDGSASAALGVELMSQAAAAFAGCRARLDGCPPQKGVVLGVRRLEVYEACFSSDQRLSVAARLSAAMGATSIFECEVRAGSELLQEGSLTVHLLDSALASSLDGDRTRQEAS